MNIPVSRVAAGLFLAAAAVWPAAPAAARSAVPVTATLPSHCTLQARGTDTWTCDFRSSGGRDRRIVLTWNVYDQHDAPIAGKSDAELRDLFRKAILDAETGRAEWAGSAHQRLSFAFLSPADAEAHGFAVCAQSREVMRATSGERVDRAHLHCWARGQRAGTVVQLLFSVLEFNPASKPVSAGFAKDARAVLSSVHRR